MRTTFQQPQVQISQVSQTLGTAMPMQMKKVMTQQSIAQMRISSAGGVRPISSLAQHGASQQGSPHVSPPNSAAQPNGVPAVHQSPPNRVAVNGLPNVAVSHSNGVQQDVRHLSPPNMIDATAVQVALPNGSVQSNSPPRPPSQNQMHAPNGFHVPNVNGYSAQALAHQQAAAAANVSGIHPTSLSPQQVRDLRAAFASSSPGPEAANHPRPPPPQPYTQMRSTPPPQPAFPLGGNATSMNLKLPPPRPQWAASQGGQPPQQQPAVNGTSVNGVDVSMTGAPGPARAPSRTARRIQMSMATPIAPPHSSPSPIPTHAHSPPRPPAAPSMQQQQTVPPGQNGF